MTGYSTTLGVSSLGNDTTNNSGENRVPITVSVTMGNSDVSGTLTLEGSATLTSYTVYYINGTTDQYGTCQLVGNNKAATYTSSSTNSWSVISNAIVADDDYTGSSGTWFKVVSSNEPNFQHANKVANHSAPHYGGTDCSTVTNGTTYTYENSNANIAANLVYYNLDNNGSVRANLSSPIGGGYSEGPRTECSLDMSAGAPATPFFTEMNNYCNDATELFPCENSGINQINPPGSSITAGSGCNIG
jgi:hypothetical protein